MRCVNCKDNSQLKEQRIVFKYKECGLDNVTLHGVLHSRCGHCGEDYYGFGNLDKLHSLIATLVISKSESLSGREIRFLRKRLGLSGAMFAKKIDIRPETLSRFENDQASPSRQFDLMLRLLVGMSLPNREYDLHDRILNGNGSSQKTINLVARGHEWDVKAA